MTAPKSSSVRSLNRLAKLRVLLAGWQLGTRPRGDPEGDAVRDHREATLVLRAETTALTRLLLETGLVTAERHDEVLAEEAEQLISMYERTFPGVTVTEGGLQIDERALEWMKGWRP